MSKSALEQTFLFHLRVFGGDLPEPVQEYRFLPGRKYRFDFCFLAQKLAVEIDGGQWAAGGGRHNKDADRWKLNEAARAGYCVIRFSGTMLQEEPERCIQMVRDALAIVRGEP